MGMLLRRHRQYWAEVRGTEEQKPEPVEELPFSEPPTEEAPVETPKKTVKTVRKPTKRVPARRNRK